MRKQLFVSRWQQYHFDLNTLSVLKSGSKSKSWHSRLSDVRGHHDADFGTLTRLLTGSMYICHRIPKIMKQVWLEDMIYLTLLNRYNSCTLLVTYHHWYQHWSIFNICTWWGSLISILMLILILGWIQTDRRKGRLASWAGTVRYRELSDGGAGHRDLSLLFASTT